MTPRMRTASRCGPACGALLFVFFSLAFLALSLAFATGHLEALDERLGSTMAAWRGPVVTALLRLVTYGGSAPVVAAVTLAGALALHRRRLTAEALAFLICAVGGYGLNEALKLLFHRLRPALPWLPPLAPAAGFSFPSGHAMSSLATFGFLAYLAWTHRSSPAPLRRILAAGCAVVPILVGASRVYLGVHYASDVLAGWALGLTWLTACLLALTLYRYKRPADRLPDS